MQFLDTTYRSIVGGTIVSRLAPREIEVLQEVAFGCTNREVARRLYLSPNTIREYMRRIFKKLDVESRVGAVVWGIRAGIIDITEEE